MLRSPLIPALLLIGALDVRAGIPAELDGHWFNPAESGHGLSLEVVDAQRAIAIWFTYTPTGAPLTLYLEGRVEGDAIVATAYAPSGMRFGDFDPLQLAMPVWGEVTLQFDDCSRGRLVYSGNDPAFGTGDFPLERLAKAAPSHCRLDAPTRLREGRYRDESSSGFVDETGAIFAGSGRFHSVPLRQATGFSIASEVTFGERVASLAGSVEMRMTYQPNGWLCLAIHPDPENSRCLERAGAAPLDMQFTTSMAGAAGIGWKQPSLEPVVASVTTGEPYLRPGFAKSSFYFFLDTDLAIAATGSIHFEANGDICVHASGNCVYRGTSNVRFDRELPAEFTFELSRPGDGGRSFVGKGFFVDHPTHSLVGIQPELWMIGSNGEVGMALQAR